MNDICVDCNLRFCHTHALFGRKDSEYRCSRLVFEKFDHFSWNRIALDNDFDGSYLADQSSKVGVAGVVFELAEIALKSRHIEIAHTYMRHLLAYCQHEVCFKSSLGVRIS
jgi:hypothetical protein